jgi:hypothetical protein
MVTVIKILRRAASSHIVHAFLNSLSSMSRQKQPLRCTYRAVSGCRESALGDPKLPRNSFRWESGVTHPLELPMKSNWKTKHPK